jgi:Gluconate 2-dehydrogenase subunit 3
MQPTLVSRRDIFKLLAAASAAGAMLPPHLAAQQKVLARGDLWDPDFLKKNIPWEKPLVDTELATLTVLCDLIIPGDADAPAPSKIGVAEFLNEWIGAPYEKNISDREIIRGGLSWLDTHSISMHEKPFVELAPAQQTGILDSICGSSEITPDLAYGHAFFRKLRALTLGGYYTHSATWKSLGYVGNAPIGGAYPGVPDEILKKLGLEGI